LREEHSDSLACHEEERPSVLCFKVLHQLLLQALGRLGRGSEATAETLGPVCATQQRPNLAGCERVEGARRHVRRWLDTLTPRSLAAGQLNSPP
jgi:hypothetical protein